MLKRLAELADKKEQVNIAFTKGKDFYLLGIAPKGAGKDKLAPFVIKGTIDEINKQLDEKLPAYIELCTKKPEPVKKKAAAKPKKKKEEKPEELKQKCRVCGCTETSPCPGGCSWAEPDLCSACVDKDKSKQTQFAFDFS